MFSVQSISNVAFLVLISFLIHTSPIFAQEFQRDNITQINRLDENLTLTDNLFHLQHSKLPLEAIEESTEELRRKTSTTQPPMHERSIAENQIHSLRSDSAEINSIGEGNILDSIHSATEHENMGKQCQKDSECQHDGLKCVRNRCRPHLDSILNKHGYHGKCGSTMVENVSPTSIKTTLAQSSTTTTTQAPTEVPSGNKGIGGNGGGSSISIQIGDVSGGNGGGVVIKSGK